MLIADRVKTVIMIPRVMRVVVKIAPFCCGGCLFLVVDGLISMKSVYQTGDG